MDELLKYIEALKKDEGLTLYSYPFRNGYIQALKSVETMAKEIQKNDI